MSAFLKRIFSIYKGQPVRTLHEIIALLQCPSHHMSFAFINVVILVFLYIKTNLFLSWCYFASSAHIVPF